MSGSSASSRAPSRTRGRGLDLFLRVLFVFAFVGGIYFSGRLGVQMAKNRIPEQQIQSENSSAPAGSEMTLGSTGEPVYLAENPEALRRFFTTYSSPGERASADLSGQSIRRVNAYILATTKRAEADAVEVVINSGAIAGAVYWVHHTQVPDRTAIDPVISPVPLTPPEEETPNE
ncbi:MAG: hypothetical protein P1U58_09590 [Verrucomicrobiales bacterium]|nr:hypothetical protein [Verrucomicrobiales bacterium]